jgi:hypothetical protein
MAHDPKAKYRPHYVKCESCNAIEDLKEHPNVAPKLENGHATAFHFYTEHVD